SPAVIAPPAPVKTPSVVRLKNLIQWFICSGEWPSHRFYAGLGEGWRVGGGSRNDPIVVPVTPHGWKNRLWLPLPGVRDAPPRAHYPPQRPEPARSQLQ